MFRSLWLAAFPVCRAAPSLGLPPELPGAGPYPPGIPGLNGRNAP